MLSAQVQSSACRPEPTQLPARYDASASRKLATMRGLGRRLDAKDPRRIREAASLLTSQLFFAPLLAEMRKLPFGREFGYGGRVEEAFGEQLDQHIADTVARADPGLTAWLAGRLAQGPRAAARPDPKLQQVSWSAEVQARQAIGRSKC